METTIEAPPERVFSALTDIEGFAAWMPNLISATKLTEGEFGEGTRFEETRKMFFSKATERFLVSMYEPPHVLQLTVDGSEGSSRSGQYTFLYRLEPAAGSTWLKVYGEIGGMNRVMGLLGRLMLPTMTRAIRKDHAALSTYLTTTTDYLE